MSVTVNDVHAQLNEASVSDVVAVESLKAVQAAVRSAAAEGKPVSIAGGRHAMGGQQFCSDGVLLDTSKLARVLGFDPDAGMLEVEAGIQWPGVIEYLAAAQAGGEPQWGIAQKQTGADRLSIGGALAANVHGRGLTMKPIISDVDSFVLVRPDGEAITSLASVADVRGFELCGYDARQDVGAKLPAAIADLCSVFRSNVRSKVVA